MITIQQSPLCEYCKLLRVLNPIQLSGASYKHTNLHRKAIKDKSLVFFIFIFISLWALQHH